MGKEPEKGLRDICAHMYKYMYIICITGSGSYIPETNTTL